MQIQSILSLESLVLPPALMFTTVLEVMMIGNLHQVGDGKIFVSTIDDAIMLDTRKTTPNFRYP